MFNILCNAKTTTEVFKIIDIKINIRNKSFNYYFKKFLYYIFHVNFIIFIYRNEWLEVYKSMFEENDLDLKSAYDMIVTWSVR